MQKYLCSLESLQVLVSHAADVPGGIEPPEAGISPIQRLHDRGSGR